MPNAYKAYAPATISNLCSGFDMLGLAIQGLGDYVIARPTDTLGVTISSIKGHNANIDKKNNTALAAVQSMYNSLNPNIGIELEIQKGYPHSSGLGSSAASAVAAVIAANATMGKPYKEKSDLFEFAYTGELSLNPDLPSDNIAASLHGGLLLSHFSDKPLRLPFPHGLSIAIVRSPKAINTIQNRISLNPSVVLEKMIDQSYFLSSLILGLYRTDFDLIKQGLQDIIIEPQRASSIEGFNKIKELALQHGTLGCSISGSGPTIFAIFQNNLSSAQFLTVVSDSFPKHYTLDTKVDTQGGRIC